MLRRRRPGSRGHLGDVGNLPEVALQRRRDAGGHGLGAGARQLRRDRDGREVHLRQRRDRQVEEGGDAGQRHADGQQHRADRAADEGLGEVHRVAAPLGLRRRRGRRRAAADAPLEPVEPQVDHRRGEQRQRLADDQAADDA